jgi:hypothetical protein
VCLGLIAPDPDLWILFCSSSDDDLVPIQQHPRDFLTMSENLNQRQKLILETVIQLTNQLSSGLMYIDGPGGCGKT